MTYIFEILMVSAFQNGKARKYKLNFGWDSPSQLLESLIKMSPDGADFGHKVYLGVTVGSIPKSNLSVLLSPELHLFELPRTHQNFKEVLLGTEKSWEATFWYGAYCYT